MTQAMTQSAEIGIGSTPRDLSEVLQSWQRCRDVHGLDRNGGSAPHVATPSEVALLRGPIESLLIQGAEELDRLHCLVRPIGYAVVVADGSGTIVERRHADAGADRRAERGTHPGALWAERLEGTNSIGTCLIAECPLNVHREQHFRRRHADLSGSAAPLYDPFGHLSAALGVASYETEISDRAHALALAVITVYARAIQERQFREHFRRASVLALERSDVNEAPILLALDADLRLSGADHEARIRLSLSDERLETGVGLWDLFDPDAGALQFAGAEDVFARLTRAAGTESWRGWITPPITAARAGRDRARLQYYTRPRIGTFAAFKECTSAVVRGFGLRSAALRRVKDHIRSNLDKSIRIDVLAGLAGLSVHHFARAFKRSVGVAPHQYVMQQRIEKAAQLLGRTDQPVSDIALATGFSDQSHLARSFRRIVGSTPSSFRRARR
jgi:transcriptional regulator of acetoin/glycerol metabolism